MLQVLERAKDELYLFSVGTFPGLLPGQFYKFQMRAVNDTGAGPWSDASFSVLSETTVPHPPEPPVVQEANLTSLLFRWNAPEEQGGSAITGFRFNVQHTGEVVDLPRSCTTQLVEFLHPGKGYRARVMAKNSVGWSDYSDWNELAAGRTKSDIPEPPNKPKPVAGSWSAITFEVQLPFANGSQIHSMQVRDIHIFIYISTIYEY